MHWMDQFDLFLFDFDGVLVNTEHLHHQAYARMCERRGFILPWSFTRYCQAAHYGPTDLRDQIYAEFQALYEMEPNWDVLYAEKRSAFKELLEEGKVDLMPGVAKLLEALQAKNINRCVVTHSPIEFIARIRQDHPALQSIPHWFTREDYTHPKPHPECYQKAIATLAKEGDRIIGFEDTPRGLQALMGSQKVDSAQGWMVKCDLTPILVCPDDHPCLQEEISSQVRHFVSFEDVKM
jgi:beta-phosphoglucomutase